MKRLLRNAMAAVAVALLPSALLAQGDSAQVTTDTTLRADTVAPPQQTEVRGAVSVRNGLRVREVTEDGTLVTLEDGIVFEIYLPDRPSAFRWREGDFVLVRRRDAPINSLPPVGRYEYLLINGRDDSAASARFAGRERAGP